MIKPEPRDKTEVSGFQVLIVTVADNGPVAVAKDEPSPHNDCITTHLHTPSYIA